MLRLLFVVLLWPVVAQAQPVLLRHAFQPGVRYRLAEWSTFETRSTIAFGGQAPADSTRLSMVSSAESEFTVAPEGANLLLTRTALRRRIWSDGPGGIEVADSDSAASLAGNPNGPFVQALIGVPVQVRMTRTGRVLEVIERDSLLHRLVSALPGLDVPDVRELAQRSINAMVDQFAALPWTLPEAALRVGDTWTDSTEMQGAVPLESVQRNRLTSAEGDTVRVQFTTTQHLAPDAPPIGAGPMAIRMQMSGTGTGEGRLNLRDGSFMLRQRSETTGQGAPAQDSPALPGLQMRMWQRMVSLVQVSRARD